MAELLGNFKNSDMNLLIPLSSKFWVLKPNMTSVLRYFQNFSHFQHFLKKLAEFYEILGIGTMNLLDHPVVNFGC